MEVQIGGGVMDKYEEWVRRYIATWNFVHEVRREATIEEMSDAIRTYDAEREKETCEWIRHIEGSGMTHWYRWTTACGCESLGGPISFCPFPGCGRRIEVKHE